MLLSDDFVHHWQIFSVSYEYQISTVLSSEKYFEIDFHGLYNIIYCFSHSGIFNPDEEAR